MTETLRDRLAAALGPGNDDTTAYAQADAVLEVLAHETQRTGICGNSPSRGLSCELSAGHTGLHEGLQHDIGYLGFRFRSHWGVPG